jgi:UDP-2,3-diacylglucosamine pyrophosphatase LpxH
MPKIHYRTVFLSDLHLGSKACKAEALSNFLSTFTCDTLYLVGDIIDFWAMSRSSTYFPQEHVNIIRKLLTKAKKGTKIKYVIGNHDENLRDYIDLASTFGNIKLANEFIFEQMNGQIYLVTHGDLYDQVTVHYKWVAKFGDIAYTLLVDLNTWLNRIRRRFKMDYWSLSGFLKNKTKSVLEFIYAFESAVVKEAKHRSCTGAICGHIHHPCIKMIDDMDYINIGDGVENCSAIVENDYGHLELIYWGHL